jgi:hypothetical protein
VVVEVAGAGFFGESSREDSEMAEIWSLCQWRPGIKLIKDYLVVLTVGTTSSAQEETDWSNAAAGRHARNKSIMEIHLHLLSIACLYVCGR